RPRAAPLRTISIDRTTRHDVAGPVFSRPAAAGAGHHGAAYKAATSPRRAGNHDLAARAVGWRQGPFVAAPTAAEPVAGAAIAGAAGDRDCPCPTARRAERGCAALDLCG